MGDFEGVDMRSPLCCSPLRISLRRLLISLFLLAALTLLTLHVLQAPPPRTGGGDLYSRGLKVQESSGASPRIYLNSRELLLGDGGGYIQEREEEHTEKLVRREVKPVVWRPMSLDRRYRLDKNDRHNSLERDRPWYMKGGLLRPKPSQINATSGHRESKLFPEELEEDRVPDQLMYLPPSGVLPEDLSDPATPLKKILLWNGASSWGNLKPGRGVFLKEECPVSSCVLASNRGEAESSDLVIYKDHFSLPSFKRPPGQLWMIYLLECPLHTQIFKQKDVFNWTATYRGDSTVVAPYERWQYYNDNVRSIKQERNYAANKTKQVAWFVSNCGARNGRLNYARELGKYIDVDIFGACGPKRCARSNASRCFSLLDNDYKFYLAFENSNCQDYITEKFFVNGLGHEVLPIAMGARPEDYERQAPYKSYIHVDQFSGPKELGEYLLKLDKNDELYNQYFQWKGTGEFINTKFWCRVCALLHDPQDARSEEKRHYSDINQWWRGDGICSNRGWRPELFLSSEKETEASEIKVHSETSQTH